jgi:hypothetical protein
MLWLLGSCAWCGCAVFSLVGTFNAVRMVQRRKPGVPIMEKLYESPFNLAFKPSKLTDEGLRARRLMFITLLAAAACWLMGFVAFGLMVY